MIKMKKIYSFDKGWKFIKENDLIKNEMEDYFDMFSSNTKTGAASGPKGEGCYDEEWQVVDLPHDWHVYELPTPEGKSAQGNRIGER